MALVPGHTKEGSDPALYMFSKFHSMAISPPAQEVLAAALQDSKTRQGETHQALLQTLSAPRSSRTLRSLPWGGNEILTEIAQRELPHDGKMFKPPLNPGQASSERASELMAEPESSRARPTAEQANAALDATPAASSNTVERKEMRQSWKRRLWSKLTNWVTGWYSVHARVMTEVVEIIEEAPRATPEMARMMETSEVILQEIDSAYEATRSRSSGSTDRPDRPAPYAHACKATTQTFG